MDKWHIIALLITGMVMLVASLLLRIYSGGKYEIKTIDLVFIVVPLLIAGLATGKLRGFDLFGVKADLSELWADAAGAQIEQQVSSRPVSGVQDAIEMIETAPKRGVGEIPRLIEQKTQALAFRLGMGGYYGPAIEKYFNDLYGSSYLRYVVINQSDGTLFGMYNAPDLIAYLRTVGSESYANLERQLNRGDARAQEWLARLPGFIAAEHAVSAGMSKRTALLVMENSGFDTLPVKDADNRFIGTVERAKLTTSLILAVTEKLGEEQR